MQSIDYRRLLRGAVELFERHGEGGQPGESFNVFSVLRTETDEVNLHSRFLAALLSHRKPDRERARNLEDFLSEVAGAGDFEADGAFVERERHYIDMLIRDRTRNRAVVIENKIWAGDQPRQLTRYAKQMEREGVQADILYLTLDGHEPEKQSAGDSKVKCVSYKYDLLPWLARCQERAYDEPALRESIAQYASLVRKLTGLDAKGEYMSDLAHLILERNNLLLVHDLNEAMVDAKVSLLEKLWNELDDEVRGQIPDVPDKRPDTEITRETIRNYLTRGRAVYHGLYYNLGNGGALAIEVERKLYFGVTCSKEECPKEHRRLKELLADLEGNAEKDNEWWPWHQWAPENVNLKHPNRDHLALLSDEQARTKYVEEIVSRMKEVWKHIIDKSG